MEPFLRQSPESVRTSPRVHLTWENLAYEIKVNGTHRQVLQGVTGEAKPGELLCIIGTSGAGKSSVMNILSGYLRASKGHEMHGVVKANGVPITDFEYSSFIAYVLQEDILLASMTVKETLMFSAQLRTQGSSDEKRGRVQQMIGELKLENVQDSYVGGGRLRGISGGEKKRVCIGMELITNPSVLFLDEPTSGLDSYTAYAIMQLVKAQSRLGRTVICSLHQPSSHIVNLIDQLVVMTRGQAVYSDSPSNVRPYFEALGYDFPKLGSPVDYLMQIICTMQLQDQRLDHLATHVKRPLSIEAHLAPLSSSDSPKTRPSFTTSLACCLIRSVREAKRNPMLLRSKLGFSLFYGLYLICLYNSIGKGEKAQQNYNGLMFMLTSGMILSGATSVALTCEA
jgi:ATP-binding cassette subfamily G (WHITE) protein 2